MAQSAAQLFPSPLAPKHAISRAVPVATAYANCHAVSLSRESSSLGADDGDLDGDGASGLIRHLGDGIDAGGKEFDRVAPIAWASGLRGLSV